jgi:two-component sensor histidine kinase
LSLQSNQLTDQTAIQAVKSSEGRVNAMALIHRKLYAGNESRAVDLKGYVIELLEYLMHSYGYTKNRLNLVIDMNPIIIDVDKAIPIGLVLNELISNSFKHAYTGIDHPELIIAVKTIANNQIQIVLHDNGKGFTPKNSVEKESFGLTMTKTLINELRGEMEVITDHGTKYTINVATL